MTARCEEEGPTLGGFPGAQSDTEQGQVGHAQVDGHGELDLLSDVPVDGDVDRRGGGEFRHVRPRRHEVINVRPNRGSSGVKLHPSPVNV